MTRRFRLSSRQPRRSKPPLPAMLCAALVAGAIPAAGPAAAQAPGQVGEIGDPNKADCANIPGGNAPIGRIARLEGGLSVRNLELTYFGKRLGDLSDRDFRYLEELWPLCGTYEDDAAAAVAFRARQVIADTKAARASALDWIETTRAEVAALRPGREAITRLHDLWQEMLNREFEMTRADFDAIASFLTEQRQRLYTGDQGTRRTLVNPFDPGPPEPRDRGG